MKTGESGGPAKHITTNTVGKSHEVAYTPPNRRLNQFDRQHAPIYQQVLA